jgi:hypothetical protein
MLTQRRPVSPPRFIPTYVFLRGGFSGAVPYGRGLCGGGGRGRWIEGMAPVLRPPRFRMVAGWCPVGVNCEMGISGGGS